MVDSQVLEKDKALKFEDILSQTKDDENKNPRKPKATVSAEKAEIGVRPAIVRSCLMLSGARTSSVSILLPPGSG